MEGKISLEIFSFCRFATLTSSLMIKAVALITQREQEVVSRSHCSLREKLVQHMTVRKENHDCTNRLESTKCDEIEIFGKHFLCVCRQTVEISAGECNCFLIESVGHDDWVEWLKLRCCRRKAFYAMKYWARSFDGTLTRIKIAQVYHEILKVLNYN